MSRLIVLATDEAALGFGLTGVEVIPAPPGDEAQTRLLGLVEDETVGLIAVSPTVLDRLEPATRRRLEALTRPVVVALPRVETAASAPSRRAQLAALLRRAVGFDLTFPGETPVQ
jgi:vacuolar-type H+-ATPase subunit F/Vma7